MIIATLLTISSNDKLPLSATNDIDNKALAIAPKKPPTPNPNRGSTSVGLMKNTKSEIETAANKPIKILKSKLRKSAGNV